MDENDKRQSSDYDDFKEFTKEEVENLHTQNIKGK